MGYYSHSELTPHKTAWAHSYTAASSIVQQPWHDRMETFNSKQLARYLTRLDPCPLMGLHRLSYATFNTANNHLSSGLNYRACCSHMCFTPTVRRVRQTRSRLWGLRPCCHNRRQAMAPSSSVPVQKNSHRSHRGVRRLAGREVRLPMQQLQQLRQVIVRVRLSQKRHIARDQGCLCWGPRQYW